MVYDFVCCAQPALLRALLASHKATARQDSGRDIRDPDQSLPDFALVAADQRTPAQALVLRL